MPLLETSAGDETLPVGEPRTKTEVGPSDDSAYHAISAKAAANRLKELEEKRRRLLMAKMAPVFGVSPLKLFPFMALVVLTCHFNCMPFGLSILWAIPLILCVLM